MHRVLSMEIVALRDIAEGEEVLYKRGYELFIMFVRQSLTLAPS
jgi:hypothetical protein